MHDVRQQARAIDGAPRCPYSWHWLILASQLAGKQLLWRLIRRSSNVTGRLPPVLQLCAVGLQCGPRHYAVCRMLQELGPAHCAPLMKLWRIANTQGVTLLYKPRHGHHASLLPMLALHACTASVVSPCSHRLRHICSQFPVIWLTFAAPCARAACDWWTVIVKSTCTAICTATHPS